LQRGIANPVRENPVSASVGLQDGIERKFLLGASAGMCGDESQIAGQPAGEQVAYFLDMKGEVLLKLGENVGVGGGREGRYFLYYDLTEFAADCLAAFSKPARHHWNDPGCSEGSNGSAYLSGFGGVEGNIV